MFLTIGASPSAPTQFLVVIVNFSFLFVYPRYPLFHKPLRRVEAGLPLQNTSRNIAAVQASLQGTWAPGTWTIPSSQPGAFAACRGLECAHMHE
jgi:hypothetical protein